MTHQELMLRTLEKVTGQPRPHLVKVVEYWAAESPGATDWNKELSPQRQLELEKAFEAEASGILAWYAKVLQKDAELREDRIQCIQQENLKKYRRRKRR